MSSFVAFDYHRPAERPIHLCHSPCAFLNGQKGSAFRYQLLVIGYWAERRGDSVISYSLLVNGADAKLA
jgi:hypothetical protein